MKYHELLELYKKKELGEEQREMVERDLERHEAISEYLFEKEEADILQGSAEMAKGSERQSAGKGKNAEDDFTKRVNRAIRRAFLKMGAAVCAVTLIVVLLILFVLPNIWQCIRNSPCRALTGMMYRWKTGGTETMILLSIKA